MNHVVSKPKACDVGKPVSSGRNEVSHKLSGACDEILKLLERNTAAGAYLSQVFTDWLDLTHATLSALPNHALSAATAGTLAEDTPETQALFARCRARYGKDWAWNNFATAFHILLDSAEGFWNPNAPTRESHGWDVIGAVYMLSAYKKHSGQYFTPWDVAELMARMTIRDGAQEINDRLRQAQHTASARGDANSHLLAATILASLAVREDEVRAYFLTRVLPLIAADFDPITICDPCIGSGVTMLAAARQFPVWAVQTGLVRLYGMDIDAACVKMAQVNFMLYGISGFGLQCALTATPRQLASLPEPFQQAYSLAQEAKAAGDTDLVTEIADTLRVQQALFDVDEFTHRVKTQSRAAVQRPRPQSDTIEQFIIPW
jgi:hypothetical protein